MYRGDSGGPMLGIDLNSTYQAAIVSWGMYTNIYKF